MDDRTRTHISQMDEAVSAGSEKLQGTIHGHKEELKQLQDRYEGEIASIHSKQEAGNKVRDAAHSEALQALREEAAGYRQAADEAHRQSAKSLDEAHRAHRAEMEEARSASEAALRSREEDHAKAVRDLRDRGMEDARDMMDRHVGEFKELQAKASTEYARQQELQATWNAER